MVRALTFSPIACLTAGAWTGALLAEDRAETMFPSDVGWDSEFLASHGEPALWVPQALDKYPSRLRMTVDGINCLRVIVRVDETPAHRFIGSYVSERRCGRRNANEASGPFVVSRREMEEFHSLAQAEGILQQPRQGWNLPDDEICIDGEEVLIEFADDAGYRATAANMSCTAPPNFRKVAEALLDLADAEEAKAILLP